MLRTIILLVSAAFLLGACGNTDALGNSGGFLGTGIGAKVGDACPFKDNKGIESPGTLELVQRGFLECLQLEGRPR